MKYVVGAHTFEVQRNMRGELQAQTEVPMPSKPGYLLCLTTSKGSRGPATSVQAVKDEGTNPATGFSGRSFVMFGDFSARIPGQAGRATEKAIADQHSNALGQLDALMAQAQAFYAAKGEGEATAPAAATERAYIFVADPGHGWLEVPLTDAQALGVTDRISGFSYVDPKAGMAYLEEDCDMGHFMRAAREAGWKVTTTDTHCQGDAFVRRLPRFANNERFAGEAGATHKLVHQPGGGT